MQGGRVDVNIRNLLPGAVDVFARASLDTGGEFELRGTLESGAGARFATHERESWVAKDTAGAVRWAWVADVAKGVLQDASVTGVL